MTVEPEKEAAYGGAAGPPTLTDLERADPFAPHDLGCRCYPHVSQRAAVEASVQAATAEYRMAAAAAAAKTGDLFTDLETFGRLLEAEWYNGNLSESSYLRLNRDLGGVIARHRQLRLQVADSTEAGPPDVLEGGAER